MKNLEIKFFPDEKGINEFINIIKTFGQLKLIGALILSSIIKDGINNNDLINNWIEESINKNKIKYELIFKLSKNGTKSEDFHKFCDDKGPTLTLVKTTKNKIFGEFTPLNWSSQGYSIKDLSDHTFIFSLNLKKKYNMIKKDGIGIYCAKEDGPNFGGADFRLNENMKTDDIFANNSCNFLRDNN